MLTFRQLTLEDKLCFDRILDQLQSETSDLTFTNLFMWKHNYGLQFYYDPTLDYWILFAKPPLPKWKPFFLPPVGDWSDLGKLESALQIMETIANDEKMEFRIRRAPRRLLEAFQTINPNFSFKEERYTYDYVYRSADLIQLAGRKYHSKRNHLNQFLRKYHSEFQLMNAEIAQECLALETEWFNISRKRELLSDEEWAMATIFNNFQELNLKGAVIRVEGQIQALSVGERLNRNMAVIHIEKANTEFDGIYAAINQQFAQESWSELEFINREEDMGLEGLRKAKLSYNPERLVEKFSIWK